MYMPPDISRTAFLTLLLFDMSAFLDYIKTAAVKFLKRSNVYSVIGNIKDVLNTFYLIFFSMCACEGFRTAAIEWKTSASYLIRFSFMDIFPLLVIFTFFFCIITKAKVTLDSIIRDVAYIMMGSLLLGGFACYLCVCKDAIILFIAIIGAILTLSIDVLLRILPGILGAGKRR